MNRCKHATLRVRVSAVMLSLLLASCGGAPSDVDENVLLASIGFHEPVSLVVQLTNIAGSPSEWTNQEARLAAALHAARHLSVIADPSRDPWWHFNVDEGTVQNGRAIFPVGARVIEGRSGVETWDDQGSRYFAQTITYSIDINESLASVVKPNPAGHTLRLVAVKDPAVGTWQVLRDSARGTKYGQSDAAVIATLAAASGHQSLHALADAVDRARTSAFDELERRLAASGTLERSKEASGVLVSRSRRLLYYPGQTLPLSSTVVLGMLKTQCGKVRAANASWRVPSADELGSIFTRAGELHDTPDGRLWGGFATVLPPGFIVVSSTATKYTSYSASSHLYTMTAYTIKALGSQFKRQFRRVTLMPIGPNADSAPIVSDLGKNGWVKVLCVADMKGA
ncbi:hypothetical protein [Sinimarinibacterium flocculans]|uniref:hypothetical protein n=1 Tax=Sinimarinibacterium flocculans TaxID=985250 RepID=UPI003511542E